MKTRVIARTALIGLSIIVAAPATAQHDHSGGNAKHGEMHTKPDAAAVEGKGVINSVNSGTRSVNLSHEPIPAIGWPSMTMDMEVAEGVALSEIQDGDAVTFTLGRGPDGIYMITGVTPAP